jgi:Fe-S-cluster containining protein
VNVQVMDHYKVELADKDDVPECGDCQACCYTHGVHDEEFDKRHFKPCIHQCPSGCAIYESRPSVCRDYHCWWKTGKFGKHKNRPDKLGLVLDYNPVTDYFYAWEIRKGAATTKRALRAIKKLKKEFGRDVVIVDKSVVDVALTLPKDEYDHVAGSMIPDIREKMAALMRGEGK